MSKKKYKPAVAVKRKLYPAKLEAEGVPSQPIFAQTKPIRQFQLAHLAATLAGGPAAYNGASELTATALQLWNSAGKTLVIAEQTEVLLKGLLVVDRNDWTAHSDALICSLDDLDGAVLGHNPNDQIKESREKAQVRAGLAVCQGWKIEPGSENALRTWFPGTNETAESRKVKFFELVAFATKASEQSDELPWVEKDADKLKASLRSTWAPLALPDERLMETALVLINFFLNKYGEMHHTQNMAAIFPLLARWFTVMRQDQLAAAKNRT